MPMYSENYYIAQLHPTVDDCTDCYYFASETKLLKPNLSTNVITISYMHRYCNYYVDKKVYVRQKHRFCAVRFFESNDKLLNRDNILKRAKLCYQLYGKENTFP